ncbi:acyl-[acyl-carrier-protein] thioesterase [Oceanobacillus senegalensis]|uniref:acyl-[acyl-carrier-protein] thioesterase n=1 Tax=Oceanobacillus senegalensis TaxID=1936063 RepID=UPI000A30DF70|nr:acyl-ACP thioesterase domain-containing protein [Oceanobacillus senegalensis]
MEVSIVFKKNYHVDLRDVDFTKRLKSSTLFSYFQEIASLSAAELGVGIEVLADKHGVAWILTRTRVEIIRMPSWDEEIVIETWPQEPGRLEFERDFIVRDKEGNPIIRAISGWVIMDLKERKIKRPSTISFDTSSIHEDRALDVKLKKLKSPGGLEVVYEKVIGYSDVDFNGHLNNSRYVDYIMDCFPIEEHRTHTVRAIEVNFNHEALPGDTIVLQKNTKGIDTKGVYIEGLNKRKDLVVFKAMMEVEEK